MRAVVFFISIFFLLFYGGNKIYAVSQESSVSCLSDQNFSENNQFKFAEQNQNLYIFEPITFDLEEELHNSNLKDSNKKIFLIKDYNFIKSFYNINYKDYFLNHFCKSYQVFSPFSGFSIPIYISIQVLRI